MHPGQRAIIYSESFHLCVHKSDLASLRLNCVQCRCWLIFDWSVPLNIVNYQTLVLLADNVLLWDLLLSLIRRNSKSLWANNWVLYKDMEVSYEGTPLLPILGPPFSNCGPNKAESIWSAEIQEPPGILSTMGSKLQLIPGLIQRETFIKIAQNPPYFLLSMYLCCWQWRAMVCTDSSGSEVPPRVYGATSSHVMMPHGS